MLSIWNDDENDGPIDPFDDRKPAAKPTPVDADTEPRATSHSAVAAAAAAGEASNPLGGPSGSVESLLAKIEAVLVAKGSAADEEEWEVVPAAAGEVAPADVPADVPAAAGAE